MITIALIIAAIAMLMVIGSRHMAENTGIVVPDNCIYCGGGDPAYIYLTANGAITPGDNVKGHPDTSNKLCVVCGANEFFYIGTADLNDEAVLTGDETAMTHDWAQYEVVPIITGNCHVRKIIDTNGATAGEVARVGSITGTDVEDANAAGSKYCIGRFLEGGTDGESVLMKQW
jgi:hypothetical protein